MPRPNAKPRLTRNGVIFTISIGSLDRQCLVSKEALVKLSELKCIDTSDAEVLDVFHAFESTISGIAHRLMTADTDGTPLVLTPTVFIDHAAQRH